jgi:hypothetical protein
VEGLLQEAGQWWSPNTFWQKLKMIHRVAALFWLALLFLSLSAFASRPDSAAEDEVAAAFVQARAAAHLSRLKRIVIRDELLPVIANKY